MVLIAVRTSASSLPVTVPPAVRVRSLLISSSQHSNSCVCFRSTGFIIIIMTSFAPISLKVKLTGATQTNGLNKHVIESNT